MGTADYNKPLIRDKVFLAYKNNIITYLKLKYPDDDPKDIQTKVETYVQQHCRDLKARLKEAKARREGHADLDAIAKEEKIWPTVDVAIHEDEYGNHVPGTRIRNKQYDLLKYVNKYNGKILTPLGSAYELPEIRPSELGIMQTELKTNRGVDKKKMLVAKRDGNQTKAQHYHNTSNSTKYVMNSMPGNMGAGYHIISSVANFNAVTSTSRQVIMRAYSHMEKYLAGNFYFTTINEVINFIVICIRGMPKIRSVVTKYNLHEPSVEEVYKFLTAQLHKYMVHRDRPEIRTILEALEQDQLTFIFYMSNMYHLIKYNDSYFREYFTDFFSEDNVDMTKECEASELKSLDEDLLIVLSTMYRVQIPKNASGNNIGITDTISSEPELAKTMYRVGLHCQKKLDDIDDLVKVFIGHSIATPNVLNHKSMFRYCVINSDTDSVLFTTKDWIEWYTRSLAITDSGLKMNALTVYLASKANAGVMFGLSRSLGATGGNLYKIAMKNEFFMPIEILSNLRKHYFSIIMMQEGVYYGEPQADIKGGAFRGSDTSKATAKFTRWLQLSCMKEIMNTGKMTMGDKILAILKFERIIYDSIIDQSPMFLKLKPVKVDTGYKNADTSIYFNYLLWEEVFADDYGHLELPTKGYVIPISSKAIRSPEYMESLRSMNAPMASRLQGFLDKYPKKNITYLVINASHETIPKEIIPLGNIRKIIFDSVRTVHLAMASIGLPMANNKTNLLYSDTYGWITKEDAEDQKQCIE